MHYHGVSGSGVGMNYHGVRSVEYAYTTARSRQIQHRSANILLNTGAFITPKQKSIDPWFGDQCRRAFGLKQAAHLRWTQNRPLEVTGKSLSAVK